MAGIITGACCCDAAALTTCHKMCLPSSLIVAGAWWPTAQVERKVSETAAELKHHAEDPSVPARPINVRPPRGIPAPRFPAPPLASPSVHGCWLMKVCPGIHHTAWLLTRPLRCPRAPAPPCTATLPPTLVSSDHQDRVEGALKDTVEKGQSGNSPSERT